MKSYFTRVTTFVALLGLAVALIPANAAGVALSVTTPANGEVNVVAPASGRAEVTFQWASLANYDTGNVIAVSVTPTPSSTANIANCSVPSADFSGGAGSFGGFSGTGANFTFTDSNMVPGTDSLCLSIPFDTATTANYSIAIYSTGATQEYGAAMMYLNGGNDVLVTGTVPVTLSFMITQPNDINTAQNTCSLGTLSSAAAASCAYRLKVQTNAAGGYMARVLEQTPFGTGSATLTKVVAGTNIMTDTNKEEYGFALYAATSGGRNTGTGYFTQPHSGTTTANYMPIPDGISDFVWFGNGTMATATNQASLVRHAAVITAGTPAGFYQHTVTYRVTGTF